MADFLDLGCGYGGLLTSVSELYPDKNILGMEIRHKVSNYVKERIVALRKSGKCLNAAVIRTNGMKFLPNYLKKSQVCKNVSNL